ncbi:SAM-dependent methyltransferase [bacterium]|nr:MAG: SAM-dependent methyltransferase [bacterium]
MNTPIQTDSAAQAIEISHGEFLLFQKLIFDIAGISLSDAKKTLLAGRLSKRLKSYGYTRFGDYYRHVTDRNCQDELQVMVDLLTTNETYFFREPKHFDFLRLKAGASRSTPFRVWSAASSSGEEAYSIAMVLAECLGGAKWEVVGTDISSRMLARAQSGHYRVERIDGIPLPLLKRYCLKGFGEQAGTLLISRELRQRIQFLHSNLMNPRRDIGNFDVIFLRNVMIYFDNDTKRKVIANLLPYLKPDGHFIVGHSESLNGLTDALVAVQPTIYQCRGLPCS